MFCPQCGSSQADDLKYCKNCGGNLKGVRQAVASREAGGKIDWNKTWVAEMFLSEGEREKRKEQLERERGITPEVKRQNEVKAGVITAFVGIGVAIFLFVFMEGVIRSLHNPGSEVEILSRLWIAGVIPFFVGLGLIINGMFVGRDRRRKVSTDPLAGIPTYPQLSATDTQRFIESPGSVTDQTTRNLEAVERRIELKE